MAMSALCVLTAGYFIGLMVGGVRGFRGAKEDLNLAHSLEFKAAPDGFVGHSGVTLITYSIYLYTRATPTIYYGHIYSPGDVCIWISNLEDFLRSFYAYALLKIKVSWGVSK